MAEYAERDGMSLEERLERIEGLLTSLIERHTVKDWYSTDDVAKMLGKAKFTVREWARLGRVRAKRQRSGHGSFASWVISHEELLRYQSEGLLPLTRPNMEPMASCS
jgi:hypothetical protein